MILQGEAAIKYILGPDKNNRHSQICLDKNTKVPNPHQNYFHTVPLIVEYISISIAVLNTAKYELQHLHHETQ